MASKIETSLEKGLSADFSTNIGKSERILSVGAGLLMTLSGLARLFSNPFLAVTEVGAGAMLLDRGISGCCIFKKLVERKQDEEQVTSQPAPLSTAATASDSTVNDAINLGSGSRST